VRLLLVTNDFPPKPGGIQQYLAGLVDAWPGEVRVLAPAHPGADTSPGVVRGHRRFMWPTRRTRCWITAEAEDFGADVVLFGAPHPLAHAGPAVRDATGIPFGILCHGAEVTIPAAIPLLRRLVRHPMRQANRVFAVSQFTAARVARLTGGEVAYVGSAANPAFTPAEQPPTKTVIGCVSRFVPRKGQRRVLAAAARLQRDGHDVEVMLVGRGRDEGPLRRLATRLAVPTRFEVGVPFERLPELYREMTMFAMPCRSRWFGLEAEGLGVVFLEAAASGLPVVAGDSGGAPETIRPGATGYVATGAAEVTGALATLLADPVAAAEMGRRGREHVAVEYTWSRVVKRICDGLEEAVATRR